MRIFILILLIKTLGFSQSLSDMTVGLHAFVLTEWKGPNNTWFKGELPDKKASFELIGSTANIVSFSIYIKTDKADTLIMKRNLSYTMQFIRNALPGWKDPYKWVAGGIEQSTLSNSEVTKIAMGKFITIKVGPENKDITIQIESIRSGEYEL